MASERERARLDRAAQARSGTGVEIAPDAVAALEFLGENEGGTTEWRIPSDVSVTGDPLHLTLAPGDVMRYGLQERMREAILAQDGPGFVTGRGFDAPAPPEGSNPPARLTDQDDRPRVTEGRTDDGWRWSLVHDEGSGEWMVALDNKPAVQAAAQDLSAPWSAIELQRAVIPLDIVEAVARGAGR